MSKLHEILAVKSGILGKFTKLKADLIALFTSKKHHFIKEIVVYKPLDEKQPEVKEKDVDLQTTVNKELAWIGQDFAKLLDLCHSINLTNCIAKADVIVNDVVVLKQVPATGLLELEKYIASFKELIEQIPTLDPVKGFKKDEQAGVGVYRAVDRVTHRTEKQFYAFILAPATDKFPANVVEKSKDVTVGHKHESEWSGMLTPSEKSTLITRCEDLINGIKAAQSRANSTEVQSEKIGETVVKHLIG